MASKPTRASIDAQRAALAEQEAKFNAPHLKAIADVANDPAFVAFCKILGEAAEELSADDRTAVDNIRKLARLVARSPEALGQVDGREG